MLCVLNLPAAVGTLRLADAAGAVLDHGLVDDDAYYLRLSNIFRADFTLRFASSEFAAAYTLRIVPDATTLTVAPFHTVDLRYAYITPRLVVALGQSAGIGDQVFLGGGRVTPQAALGTDPMPATPPLSAPTLATAGALDTNVLPASTTLPVLTLRSSAGVGYRWERRLRSVVSAGYQLYGGMDHAAQAYLPLQRSLDGTAAVDYLLTPRINLVTALVGARTWLTTDQRYLVLTLSESVMYTWTRTTKLDAGAGISSQLTESPQGADTLAITPVASLGISHTLGGRDLSGSLRLSLTYAPLVDSVSGNIQDRLSVIGTASASQGDLRAGVSVGFFQTIPPDEPGAYTSVSGMVFGGYQFSDWLGMSVSAQAVRQKTEDSSSLPATRIAPSGFTWGLYAGLYAVSPNIRF